METLKNRLQASVLFSVSKCNPNGDPLNANRPRTDYDGYGFMTRECIQRKIRNRLQQMGYDIFIQSENSVTDGNKTLKERFAAAGVASKTREETAAKACEKWFDVRSFGQIFAFKADKEDAGGDSIGIRGPVSTQDAYSIDPVEVESIQITKSCSSELKEGGYSGDTPAAVVYKATWQEEMVVRTTLDGLTEDMEKNHIVMH